MFFGSIFDFVILWIVLAASFLSLAKILRSIFLCDAFVLATNFPRFDAGLRCFIAICNGVIVDWVKFGSPVFINGLNIFHS